eukprot:scaffold6036_cov371-Prasinococcus_capsulatus_cf.AAC.6
MATRPATTLARKQGVVRFCSPSCAWKCAVTSAGTPVFSGTHCDPGRVQAAPASSPVLTKDASTARDKRSTHQGHVCMPAARGSSFAMAIRRGTAAIAAACASRVAPGDIWSRPSSSGRTGGTLDADMPTLGDVLRGADASAVRPWTEPSVYFAGCMGSSYSLASFDARSTASPSRSRDSVCGIQPPHPRCRRWRKLTPLRMAAHGGHRLGCAPLLLLLPLNLVLLQLAARRVRHARVRASSPRQCRLLCARMRGLQTVVVGGGGAPMCRAAKDDMSICEVEDAPGGDVARRR